MDTNEVIDHLAKRGMTVTKGSVWQARSEQRKAERLAAQASSGAAAEPVFLPPPVSYGTQRRARRPAHPISELSALQQRVAVLGVVAKAIDGLDEESVSWVFETLMTALTKPRKAIDRTVRESYGNGVSLGKADDH